MSKDLEAASIAATDAAEKAHDAFMALVVANEIKLDRLLATLRGLAKTSVGQLMRSRPNSCDWCEHSQALKDHQGRTHYWFCPTYIAQDCIAEEEKR